MAGFRTPQFRLTIEDRQYHFVAYEGAAGNPRRDEAPTAAMWYLMVPGRRQPVMAYDEAQSEQDVQRSLTKWVHATMDERPLPAELNPAERVDLWEE
jgi:hypothetical protein